jgi:hypothetical protein
MSWKWVVYAVLRVIIEISATTVALCDKHKFLQGDTTLLAEKAAQLFPIGIQDISKKAHFAAGKTTLLNYIFVWP